MISKQTIHILHGGKTLRGGSMKHGHKFCRSAKRSGDHPNRSGPIGSFRVIIVP